MSGTTPATTTNANTLTVAAWVNFTGVAADQTLVALQTAGAANAYELFHLTAAGFLEISALDPTTAAGVSTGATALTAGVATHVACTMGRTSRQVFLNGVADSSIESTDVNPTLDTIYVGAIDLGGFGAFLNATIGEVAVWGSGGLTAAELLLLATNRLHPRFVRPDRLISYYSLLGGVSPEVNTWKTSANLTLTNAPTAATHFQMAYPHIGMARKMPNTPFTPTPLTPPTLAASTQWQLQRLDLRISDDGHS